MLLLSCIVATVLVSMKYSILFGCIVPLAPACALASIVCFANVAQAKSAEEIRQIARSATVELLSGTGSGVIVHRQGNVYTIVTNRHVLCGSSNCKSSSKAASYRFRTTDGQVYQVPKAQVQLLNDSAGTSLDLALLRFRSDRSYRVAQVAPPKGLKVGDPVYSAGFPKNLGFRYGSGRAIAVVNKRLKDDGGGYSVIYNAPTLPGMSGGAVFDQEGRLVAIHGMGDRFRENTQVEDLSDFDNKATMAGIGTKIGYNRGIPVRWVVQGLKSQGLSIGQVGPEPAVNPSAETTADEFFIAGFNYWVEPGDNITAGKRLAIDFFTKCLKINPNYKYAYIMRAVMYNQLQDYPKALADYDQAIALGGDSAIYNNRGILKHQRLNDFRGAFADYSQAIALEPNQADSYNNRAFLRETQLNDLQGGLDDYNRAIALEPQNSLVYNNRAYVKAYGFKDYRGALADYDRAIAIDPKNALFFNNRAFLREVNLKDPQGGLADYTEAIALRPRYATAYYNRGYLKNAQLQDYQGALKDYDQAILYKPQNVNAYASRSILKYTKLNDRAGGIADMQQVAKIARAQGNTKILKMAQEALAAWGATE
jgi:tetratricopeptide (TPR) repeat protein/V8-like Glu-specific endopeptidase